jgi:lysylphosphatidylglycerol synthetase-like protein (DUF2156 family)
MSRRVWAMTGIVMLAALSRLVPHPPNVTPVAAMALFGGAYMVNRKLAYGLPLVAMSLSDVVLGFTLYGKAILMSQPVVYACIVLTVWLGKRIRDRKSTLNVVVIAWVSSILFFVVTNFAVWASGHRYPKSLAGIQSCYVAAIPFFRNSLVGDMLFTAVLFGGFALLEKSVACLRETSELAAA